MRLLARVVGVVTSGALGAVSVLVVTAAPAQADCVSGFKNPRTGQFVCTQTSTQAPPPARSGPQNVTYSRHASTNHSSSNGRGNARKGPRYKFDMRAFAKQAGGLPLVIPQTQTFTGGCSGAMTTTTVNRQSQVVGKTARIGPTRACAQPRQGQQQQQSNGAPPPPQITPQQAAQTAIARMQFTAAGPGAGPTSADNDLPFDAPVGYPVWLWADGGTTTDRTVGDAVAGMAVQITVHFDHLNWDAGDGSGTFTCGAGTQWVKGAAEPAADSPTCDHVYQDMGRYTITATTHWTINWAAGGQTGTVPMAIAQSRPFSVGELQTVLTS